MGCEPQHVFHSIRKTVVTILENAGVAENIVADIVGHEKTTMTFGRIKQEIYDDEYGLDAWDQWHSSRCFVTVSAHSSWARRKAATSSPAA